MEFESFSLLEQKSNLQQFFDSLRGRVEDKQKDIGSALIMTNTQKSTPLSARQNS